MWNSVICGILLVAICAVQAEEVNESENGVCEMKGGYCSSFTGDEETTSIKSNLTIHVFTMASEDTDGYQRFNRSARINGVNVETLGWGVKWQGKGYKLNLLKRALKRIKTYSDPIILYTDCYDVIFTQSLDEIVHKFQQMNAGILFGAEKMLRTDQTVEHLYPNVQDAVGYPYLNAGTFIGYLSHINELLSVVAVKNFDSDQMILERAYLDETVRERLKIRLDHRATIFQNLHGSIADLRLDTEKRERILVNIAYKTTPSIIHGNGPSKMFLNNYGNYIAGAFVDDQCVECSERIVALKDDEQLPTITVALFILQAMPFFHRYLNLIESLDYPKNKLDIFIFNANGIYNDEIASIFAESRGYHSVKRVDVDKIDEAMARNMAITHTQQTQTEYLFVIDADAHLEDAQTLRELLKQNRTFIAPMLQRDVDNWSNFWGALNENGFYARSHDYMAIVQGSIRGIWNVPYISSCYLAKATILPLMNYYDANAEPDMALCQNLRQQGIFMYVSNERDFGHLVNADGYNPLLTQPDLYTLESNPLDWERQYIHADYASQLEPNVTHQQPCPDVFWFPIVTEKFAADLIEIMEAYGQWSDGGSSDTRLKGGYEAVPTRDIHMTQVGLEGLWLKFLLKYVRPLTETVYGGYVSNPPKAHMNFVVRYKPTEQAFLKPHHDTSTYTINIALNRVGIDYEGGGCRFLRYDCAVRDTKVGHMLMHPGRLTHFHEGLYVTNGTRYIMVSFIDPLE